MLAIPTAVNELNNEFLDRMIRHRIDDCEIVSFDADTIFDGKSRASDLVRIEVTHSELNCDPSSLIIKFPRPGSTMGIPGIYRREADIFKILQQDDDLAVPEMYGYEVGDDPNQVVIALEEITDSHTVSPTEGCSVEESTEVLRNIARIHSRFWNDSRVPPMGTSAAVVERFNEVSKRGWNPLVERYGSSTGAALAQFEWVRDNPRTWLEHRGSSPQTLAHGDFQPENILLTTDPLRRNVIIDWQLAGAGPGICDVAIFIVSSLTVEERRNHEDALLRAYHEVLTADGTFDYPFDEMFYDYRAANVTVMFKALLKSGWTVEAQPRADVNELADAIFERALAAAEDLNPVEAMKESMAHKKLTGEWIGDSRDG